MHCKSYSHFFSKKYQHICVSLDVNFNESLTNDIVSFEQLGPELCFVEKKNDPIWNYEFDNFLCSSVKILCSKCSAGPVNSNEKLSFSVDCDSCFKQGTKYEWSLYRVADTRPFNPARAHDSRYGMAWKEFYFIVSGEISVYLMKIKVVSITSELISYHFTIVNDTIYIYFHSSLWRTSVFFTVSEVDVSSTSDFWTPLTSLFLN